MILVPDQDKSGHARYLCFSILGTLVVHDGERQVHLGSRKQQVALAALICRANSLVPVDSLVAAIWPEGPPRTARKNVQVYLSVLRGLLGSSSKAGTRISYHAGAYSFHAAADEVDWLSFERQVQAARQMRQSASPAEVSRALTDALKLWRGRVLEGMREISLIDMAAQRLERLHLSVFEDWAEAELAAGAGAGVIDRVTEMAAENPLRERLRMLQMTALRQAGRRAEALAVYDDLRQSLARELGLSPGQAIITCYQSLLHEGEIAAPHLGCSFERPAVPPNLLPWDLPDFTGRAQQVKVLKEALAGGGRRLAVVTGLLGAGKSALAVHVAHQLAASFPDGRFFVRLRDEEGALRPLDDIVPALMWALAPAVTSDPLPTGPRAWQLWLATHRALVILDDARKEQDVRALLPEGGESTVIVTARARLPGLDGAYRVCVPPFSMREAAGFLARVVGSERVGAEAVAVRRIAAACGALPLALRMVAERLSLLGHVSLEDYASRLAGPSGLLDELTAGDVAVRTRLGEAIRDLPEPAGRAVVSLGRLPVARFTAAQAALVLDADEVTAVRVLESLLAAGVITASPAIAEVHAVRYELPALTYAYATEMAASVPELRRPAHLAPQGLA